MAKKVDMRSVVVAQPLAFLMAEGVSSLLVFPRKPTITTNEVIEIWSSAEEPIGTPFSVITDDGKDFVFDFEDPEDDYSDMVVWHEGVSQGEDPWPLPTKSAIGRAVVQAVIEVIDYTPTTLAPGSSVFVVNNETGSVTLFYRLRLSEIQKHEITESELGIPKPSVGEYVVIFQKPTRFPDPKEIPDEEYERAVAQQ